VMIAKFRGKDRTSPGTSIKKPPACLHRQAVDINKANRALEKFI